MWTRVPVSSHQGALYFSTPCLGLTRCPAEPRDFCTMLLFWTNDLPWFQESALASEIFIFAGQNDII